MKANNNTQYPIIIDEYKKQHNWRMMASFTKESELLNLFDWQDDLEENFQIFIDEL